MSPVEAFLTVWVINPLHTVDQLGPSAFMFKMTFPTYADCLKVERSFKVDKARRKPKDIYRDGGDGKSPLFYLSYVDKSFI